MRHQTPEAADIDEDNRKTEPAQWTVVCPKCGEVGQLVVVSAVLCSNGKRIRPRSFLSTDGFDTDPEGRYSDLQDHSTEDERVRCLRCRSNFDLCDLTFESLAEKYGWSEIEAHHASGAMADEFDDECVVLLANGREIHTPAHPESCDYVRIVDHFHEMAYWSAEEWQEEPEEVMGAIMGAMKSGDKVKVG